MTEGRSGNCRAGRRGRRGPSCGSRAGFDDPEVARGLGARVPGDDAPRRSPRSSACSETETRTSGAQSGASRSGRSYESRRGASTLQDPDPHVRMESALALGKLGDRRSLDAVFAMLRENDDRDLFLRHAGVSATRHGRR
ncbi:MAG: HEAT repeat domain-containing protein [Isosphaeraceae bacterium]